MDALGARAAASAVQARPNQRDRNARRARSTLQADDARLLAPRRRRDDAAAEVRPSEQLLVQHLSCVIIRLRRDDAAAHARLVRRGLPRDASLTHSSLH